MQFFKKPNINFVGKRKQFFILSSIFIGLSILLIFVFGFRFGIDFTGGTEIAIKVEKPIETNQLRTLLSKNKIYPDEIKSYGEENQFLLRLKEVGDEANKVETNLLTSLKDFSVQVLKKDTIGPKIGEELRFQALIAVLLAIIAMLIYIGLRFEFTFGIGAVVALVHDVIFTLGMIVIFDQLGIINLEINQGILAALLTVVGYSVNDTVIIFDRIRENREKHKGLPLAKIANMSINETLSRTIITVLTVLIVLVVMIFFSGPVLQGFAFTMTVGIIVGTYSSIFIATSFVLWYMKNVRKLNIEEDFSKQTATTKV
ncbi:MAG: protein translocase subunit SecF [Ignavibacteria bacterium]|nr:protein translocase subunit SecF [Ignavibacteria bacterium]